MFQKELGEKIIDKFPQGANAKVGGPMHPTHPPWLALWGIVALQTLAHSIGGLGQALDATYCGLLLTRA